MKTRINNGRKRLKEKEKGRFDGVEEQKEEEKGIMAFLSFPEDGKHLELERRN